MYFYIRMDTNYVTKYGDSSNKNVVLCFVIGRPDEVGQDQELCILNQKGTNTIEKLHTGEPETSPRFLLILNETLQENNIVSITFTG